MPPSTGTATTNLVAANQTPWKVATNSGLDVARAWEITPQLHPDSRGLFFEWLTVRAFTGSP